MFAIGKVEYCEPIKDNAVATAYARKVDCWITGEPYLKLSEEAVEQIKSRRSLKPIAASLVHDWEEFNNAWKRHKVDQAKWVESMRPGHSFNTWWDTQSGYRSGMSYLMAGQAWAYRDAEVIELNKELAEAREEIERLNGRIVR